jgi:hypothetical protein
MQNIFFPSQFLEFYKNYKPTKFLNFNLKTKPYERRRRDSTRFKRFNF